MPQNGVATAMIVCCTAGLAAATGYVAWEVTSGTKTSQRHERLFEQVSGVYDLDSNGKIMLSEIYDALPRDVVSPATVQVRFRQLDGNLDGVLSIDDLSRSYGSYIRYLDDNKDGRITEPELLNIARLFE